MTAVTVMVSAAVFTAAMHLAYQKIPFCLQLLVFNNEKLPKQLSPAHFHYCGVDKRYFFTNKTCKENPTGKPLRENPN